MNDIIFKLLALLGFIATVGILAWYVPSLDLVAVLAIVIAMVVYDFLLRPLRRRRGSA
jgi:hypothetical protein